MLEIRLCSALGMIAIPSKAPSPGSPYVSACGTQLVVNEPIEFGSMISIEADDAVIVASLRFKGLSVVPRYAERSSRRG